LRHDLTAFNQIASFSLQSGNAKGVPRGNAWVSFLSPFLCNEAKKWHPNRHTERAKLGEAVEEFSQNFKFNKGILP
jgi:hypothetical protein